MSYSEARNNFSDNNARACKPTAYAVANNVFVNSDNGNCWWWLRSPGSNSNYAADVVNVGSVLVYGLLVNIDNFAVRPALKSAILNLPIGEKFIALGNRWIMIDDGFAISEDMITHRRYDSESNVWETSELKAWLEAWAKEGEP